MFVTLHVISTYPIEFPWRMPVWFGHCRCFLWNQGLLGTNRNQSLKISVNVIWLPRSKLKRWNVYRNNIQVEIKFRTDLRFLQYCNPMLQSYLAILCCNNLLFLVFFSLLQSCFLFTVPGYSGELDVYSCAKLFPFDCTWLQWWVGCL